MKTPPASGPDRWAPTEILGHLIDSASNNHQRFVRGQLSTAVDSPGYEQHSWVAVQHYATERWPTSSICGSYTIATCST
jgi:hypothetical protein